jgi:peptidoglycan/LPS O-acetylase OafA/YrhL
VFVSSLTLGGNRVTEVRALTGVRGAAAFYVVLMHYFTPIPTTSALMRFFGHGYLAVDLFFPLSGFVMALNYAGNFDRRFGMQDYLRFLTRRFARIYPLYFVILLIASVMMARGLLLAIHSEFWTVFWSNLLMVQNWFRLESMDFPAWSISAEWFAYLLFPLLLPLVFRSRRAMWLTMTAAAAAMAALTALSLRNGAGASLDQTSGFPSLVRCVAEFSFGVAVYRSTFTRFGRAILSRSTVVYPLLLAILLLLGIRGSDLAVALLFPWFILSLSGEQTAVSRLLGSGPVEYLGQISFSLYLVHPLLSPVLNRLDAGLRQTGRVHTHALAVAVVLPLLLLCAAAAYTAIEKPGRRILRHVFDGLLFRQDAMRSGQPV